MTPEIADALNAIFELGGACLLWYDVIVVYRHKQIRGVWWPARAWFLAWGVWNLLYYPSLDQWLSFTAGLFIVAANLVWCVLAHRYRKN